jgi:hypothetical protein
LRLRVAVLKSLRSGLSIVRVDAAGICLLPVSEGGALVPGFPSDKTNPPDGRVGNINVTGLPAASDMAGSAGTTQPILWVSASGDGISDPALLADDLRLLVAQFLHRAGEQRMAPPPHAPNPEAGNDIEISLHGLNLNPAEQRELHRFIRERVHAHMKQREAQK